MSFAWPLAFLLLIPWTAIFAWALLGRHDFARVPALFLWDISTAVSGQRRELRWPAPAVLFLLTAALLGIVALAGPAVRKQSPAPAVVIIDCSWRMSAPDRVADALKEVAFVTVRVVPVPGDAFESNSGVTVDRLAFVNISTKVLLQAAVRQALRDDVPGAIYVVTDQPLEVTDARVIFLRPSKKIDNIFIRALAVSDGIADGAKPQAMVTLENHSQRLNAARATLQVDAVSQTITLPAYGGSMSYFIDLPDVADVVHAKILVDDDISADNQAWGVRAGNTAQLQALTSVSPAISRMMDVYTRHQKVTDRSVRVGVVESFFSLPQHMPGVAFSRAGEGELIDAKTSSLQVAFDHPLTRGIDWPALLADGRASGLPGSDWRVLVSVGEQVLLAVRESPVRQVWVGYNADDFASRADFVVMSARIFDWLAGHASTTNTLNDAFGASPLPGLKSEYEQLVVSDTHMIQSPGLYRDAGSVLRAVGLAKLDDAVLDNVKLNMQLSSTGVTDLTDAIVFTCLLCLVLAVCYLTRFRALHTV
jgi:hypothetical protein